MNPSINALKASDGSGNASVATVSNTRAPLATTIQVDTVQGINNDFFGTMGTPHTFTDPITGETITVISEATAVDFRGHVDGSNLEIDEIAPGYTDAGSSVGDIVVIRPTTQWGDQVAEVLEVSHNDDGTLKPAAINYQPTIGDYIQSGGVWTFTAATLTGAMTALVAWQAGYQGSVAAVASRVFTASKDTYVDVLRTLSGYTNTFTLVYTEVANGAAAPALAANSIRLAKVVSGASAITSIMQNSNVDSLRNPYRPTAPGTNLVNLDPSSFGNMNMRFAKGNIDVTLGNGTHDLNSRGCGFTVVCAEPCMAFVSVNIGVATTGDFEFSAGVALNGSAYSLQSPNAAPGFAGNRSTVRGGTFVVPLPAGTNILSGIISVANGSGSYYVQGAGCVIAAIVVGKVTS